MKKEKIFLLMLIENRQIFFYKSIHEPEPWGIGNTSLLMTLSYCEKPNCVNEYMLGICGLLAFLSLCILLVLKGVLW